MSSNDSMLAQELQTRLQDCRNTGEDLSESTIFFDPVYRGFDGHFEGNPVVPGVCIFQWIRVHLQQILGQELSLAGIDQCRFRKPLLAGMTGTCRVKILSRNNDQICIQADILSDGEPACRIKGKLVTR